jgi:hypothetical protein
VIDDEHFANLDAMVRADIFQVLDTDSLLGWDTKTGRFPKRVHKGALPDFWVMGGKKLIGLIGKKALIRLRKRIQAGPK